MLVSFRYQLKRIGDVLSWSVSLEYQVVHRYNLFSDLSVLFTHQWEVGKTSQINPCCWRKVSQFLLGTRQYIFRHLQWFGLINLSASLSLQCSEMLVSFRSWLSSPWYVLSWSVSLRHQLVCHYVPNWLALSTYQWDFVKTSQIGPSYSRTSCKVLMMSLHGPQLLNLYET